MKPIKTLACLSIVALLSACGPSDGYYDSLGNYHQGSQYNNANDASNQPGFSGESYRGNNYYTDSSARRGDSKKVVDYDRARDKDRAAFKRPGYYDYYGRYVPASPAVVYVDQEYFPARGQCRIWFQGRDYDEQPAPESCNGIKSRVPRNAYVIYGG